MMISGRLDCQCLNAEETVISDAVTVILTVWKRNHLEEQLSALFGQTTPPVQVRIQQSGHYVDVSEVIEAYRERVRYVCWEDNPGVFGRFESVVEVETPFVYIVDDDIIPGKRFIERALGACKRLNAIISPHGCLRIRVERKCL